MKFRVIQSNNHGLVMQAGDRTYARRKPAKGEELKEMPTLFIWVSKPERHLARCWTRWTGETIGSDFIYVVTRFRDVIDLQGQSCFHQWCSQQLREVMWSMNGPLVDIRDQRCPEPEAVYEANRHKSARYLQARKLRIMAQTPPLSSKESERLVQIYCLRDSLNQAAGRIEYHVDHIQPLSRGGLHHPDNLRIVPAADNIRKGAKEVCLP
jgi:hypothetical protein